MEERNLATTYDTRFNITASIPNSCHIIIGNDILSTEKSILEDFDPILICTADPKSKGWCALFRSGNVPLKLTSSLLRDKEENKGEEKRK